MPVLQKGNDSIHYLYEPAKMNADAEPVILIHGNGLNHTVFDALVPALNRQYAVLRYDLRGFGHSSLGDSPAGWEDYLADLQFLVHSIGFDRFHLAGHGFGARIAAKFAARRPESTLSVTLLSLPAFIPDHIIRQLSSYRRQHQESGSLMPLAEQLLQFITALPADHPRVQTIVHAFAQASPDAFFRIMELARETHPTHDLGALQAPALLLSGERDTLYPPHLSGIAAYFLPVYKYLIVPDSSNLVFLDQPELTADWIERHLSAAGQKPADTREGADLAQASADLQRYFRRVIEEGEKKVNAPQNELKVEILQAFRVYVNGEEVLDGWNQRKAKQILIYLLFHRSVTREQLCDALWPDVPFGKSRARLRVCLFHLNGLLNPQRDGKSPFIIADHEHLHLQGSVCCDGTAFIGQVEEAFQEKDPVKKWDAGRRVVQHFPKHFLHAVYDDWFLEIRERLENRLLAVAEWMANQSIGSGRADEAIPYLKMALSLRPGDEKLCGQLARCYPVESCHLKPAR